MKREAGIGIVAVFGSLLALATGPILAQDAPSEVPGVRVGGVLFSDFTYQRAPQGKDGDGNAIHPSAFSVTRAYVNVFGNLSRAISARVTADLVRDTDANSALSGSSVYRLKYAYAQFSLDGLGARGSWIKAGVHQTPYTDFIEGIYRYRFQGQIFMDREGYLATSDLGISGRYPFPSDYGDVVVGGFNGEGYNHTETNDQKAFQIRGTLRPAPHSGVLSGLRLTAFYDSDHYQRNDPKERFVATITFEHPRLNAGFEYLEARDRPTSADPEKRARAWSAFATPRTACGIEGLFRYDWLRPDRDARATKTRVIAGVAYWFPLVQRVSTAVLLDYERVRYASFAPARPTEERYAVHTLVNF